MIVNNLSSYKYYVNITINKLDMTNTKSEPYEYFEKI